MRRLAFLLGLAVVAPTSLWAQAATETVLYAFCAQQGCPDGAFPGAASLVEAWDGNYYGSTQGGGTLPPNTLSGGTLFKITSGGALTQLDTFLCDESVVCAAGNSPAAALLLAGDGNFYGTTQLSDGNGYGTFFKMAPSGAVTVLHVFCLQTGCPDGEHPDAPLIEGSDGNFYGTTTNYNYGADNSDPATGSVFKVTPTGTVTTLHSFCNGTTDCSDGAYPSGNLVQGSDGNFYGTTVEGGANSEGTFFQITPGGILTTLYSFSGPTSGAYPLGGLVEGSDGNFYGTTSSGGTNSGASSSSYAGTVYKITPAGVPTAVYNFCARVTGSNPITCVDGSEPLAGLFLGSDGNFYGNTFYGGAVYNANICYGCGTVFQLTPSGTLTTLYSFCQSSLCPDGSLPMSSVLQGSDGNFYGSTYGGGYNDGDSGVLYKVTPAAALAAPVQVTVSAASITVGSAVTINWQALNAFSRTMQQCYGFASNGNGTTPLGKLPGTYNASTKIYSGAAAVTPPSSGTYTYAVTCGGVESGQAALTVSGNASATMLSATPNPATVGQTVTLTATVTHATGSAAPTGTMTFSIGGQALGSAPVKASGKATLAASTNGIAPGSYPVVATYSGDGNYNSSASANYTVILDQAPTTTTLAAAPNPVTPPAKCTLTATVKRSASGAAGFATGSVTFSVGTTTIGTAKLNPSGVATLAAGTSGITAGNYPVTAKYNGDGSDTTSSSAPLAVMVQ